MLTRVAKRILIVGAGAVGQVYGHHLTLAGCDVSVLVKPKYAQAAKDGFWLHHHGIRRTEAIVQFKPDNVYTDIPSARGIWHQIWLCVPTPAIYEPWIDDLARYMTGESTIVSFQPGLDEYEYICTKFDQERVVQGMIGMISYQAPLPGEHLEPGVAFMFPPFAPSTFGGQRERATSVVELLHKSGCPAAVRMDANEQAMLGTSMLTPMIAALEVANWSFKTLASGNLLRLALNASAEAATVVEGKSGAKSWFMTKIRHPFIFKMLLPLAESLTPFPLEKYLQYHFSKVRTQTIGNMRQFLEYGTSFGTSTVALKELADLWYEELTTAQSTTMASLMDLPDPMDDMVYPIPGEPYVDPKPVASVSAGFAAVKTPILAAPVVEDEEIQQVSDATPLPGAIAPVETVLAVLIKPPKLAIVSDEPLHDIQEDHTPLPGSEK